MATTDHTTPPGAPASGDESGLETDLALVVAALGGGPADGGDAAGQDEAPSPEDGWSHDVAA